MSSPGGFVGWDLGGAHLKVAHVNREGITDFVLQLPCPLWQGLSHLDEVLAVALDRLPSDINLHAVTMTGELADIFADREDGVRQLIDCLVSRIAPTSMLVYAGKAGFVEPSVGKDFFAQVASANWMATAALIDRRLPQSLLVDIGSTTTDIAPIRNGIQTRGQNDQERLIFEELVYTGVIRTPVMALGGHIPFAGDWVMPVAEYFSTMADVYRLCDLLPAEADQMATPDNTGKTLAESTRRFARMLGCDMDAAPQSVWRQCAEYVAELQLRTITDACARNISRGNLDPAAPLVGAGSGRFLVKKLADRLERSYIDFSAIIEHTSAAEPWLASCAPAVAVANLARMG